MQITLASSSLLVTFIATTAAARADDPAKPGPPATMTWLCMPPRIGTLHTCGKLALPRAQTLTECTERHASLGKRQARIRLDRGPWTEYPRTGWRCVAIPADHRPFLTIESDGRAFASWRLRPERGCTSGIYDLAGPNGYGAVYAHCSKRKTHTLDDRLPTP